MRRSACGKRAHRFSGKLPRSGRVVFPLILAMTALGGLVAGGSASATNRHNPPQVYEACAGNNQFSVSIDIGQPYECSYAVQNTDGFEDGMTLSNITDTIETFNGAVPSGNILSELRLIFDSGPAGSPSCTGGSGLGTTASPYEGATLCTIPWEAEIETDNFSFYQVAPLDFNLPDHLLSDTATFTWQSLCASPGGSGVSCPTGDQNASIGGSSEVQQLASDTSSTVLDTSDMTVTIVEVGTAVHDAVTVGPDPTDPLPSPTVTGIVTISWFANGTCSNLATSTSGPLTLDTQGHLDATSFAQTPTTAGQYSFQSTFNSDPSNPAYAPSFGACEPLTVDNVRAITSAGSVSVIVGAPFSFTITTSGAPIPALKKAGKVPHDLTFANAHNGTATISGTPRKAGVRHLIITATFGSGSSKYVVHQRFTLTINAQ